MPSALDDGNRIWRGRSGQTYITRRSRLSEEALASREPIVALAVKIDGNGVARPVAVSAFRPPSVPADRLAWLAHAKHKGATGLRIHAPDGDVGAALKDLGGEAP